MEKRITVSLDERLHRWVQEAASEDRQGSAECWPSRAT
jgi:hypothetical protein